MARNRNQQTRLNPKYQRQQEILADIAGELGVVLFRPDYHAVGNDKNTVLFYSKEAAAENAKLDAEEKETGIRIPNCRYQMFFFAWENTDPNGFFSLEWANHGSIDLRGLHPEKAMMEAVKKAWDEYNG